MSDEERKRRVKDPETGQWVKVWPGQSVEGEKAKPAPENKAVKSAPENKSK